MTESRTDETARDAAAQAAVEDLRKTITEADPESLRLLLTEARTHYGWQDRPVSDDLLRKIYEIAKYGPTSMNQQPMRVIFVRSDAAKDRLEPCLLEGNRPKMRAAPVTAIIGYDENFYENLGKLFPVNPNAGAMFAANAPMAAANAFRNGTLQGAWLLIAARAVGLDTGAMSGFDNGAVDQAFFTGTSIKSNFLMNLGYADETKIFRRLPRLEFDDVATII